MSVSACACLRLCFCECWLGWYGGWISGWIQVLTSRPGVALDTIQDRAIYGPPQHARAHERAHTSDDVQQLMGWRVQAEDDDPSATLQAYGYVLRGTI